MGLQKLPIGLQSFEKLRNGDYLYVDKTAILYQLVHSGCYYFLSRPRRFGKSLFASTLKAYFEGRKELFKGLAIDELETEWIKYPVLYLDLNTNNYDSIEILETKLDDMLNVWESQYGNTSNSKLPYAMRFEKVIEGAYQKTGKQVVIIVDEYDKPLLQAIDNLELLDKFRATLKGFYGALKSMDNFIQFAFLTGVTKFGKVSIFSDLNNLEDLSFSPRYWNICGISEEELNKYFSPYIESLAEANSMTLEECVQELKKQYDGYHFSELSEGIYNPFSVLNTFKNNRFGSYWFETGTPTYLVYLLQRINYKLEEMSQCTISSDTLNSIDISSTDPIPTIYQSGYLTIKNYDKEFKSYTLDFPNEEVKEGFTKYLMPFYLSRPIYTPFQVEHFVRELREGKIQEFLERLRSLFADTPYELIKDLENHYQNVLWLLCTLLGCYTKAEYHTSQGRIDLVVKTQKYCYVMEFKLDGTAEEALAQINANSYELPFQFDDVKIFKIGINFSKKTRNLDKWLIEDEGGGRGTRDEGLRTGDEGLY